MVAMLVLFWVGIVIEMIKNKKKQWYEGMIPLQRPPLSDIRRHGVLTLSTTKDDTTTPQDPDNGFCGVVFASHQHKPEQCKGDALHYSDKNFATHSFTSLGHATHNAQRACDGSEDSDEDFEEWGPIDRFRHICFYYWFDIRVFFDIRTKEHI